ncbi:MAG: PEP-CTERM/exosortase system-associated acyltransferase [Thauera propionica]|jgi:N-acyl amino acid synthase of PEP-CTERM/exosortase system|uniref:GNAT family N-acetyltransferase n=1 Tax=Thauera propionica TaxID=2019431 RepID=A0A235EUY0_9RHOO|nr:MULTISPECIES: PEP-CTERM/exosortase system-associated acyltransferase [Thauera]MDD3676571.1 PEP-CTERM/exosortase system-associated acyltransferase [Thauera propionica]MDI3490062.1 hypothetical protein [Thauera sp.]MDY0046785.1 PEP-CTERM/exosortase system-associated acyltransferase [Thauera propionica]OYD52814.1 GNAT family N-acetyltransferase [Thauera propionica]
MYDIEADQEQELNMETSYFSFEEVLPGTADYERYLEARYEIFCEELGRVEPPNAISSKGKPIETDQYDPYSRHFLAMHKPTQTVAGFVRVILPSSLGLNVTPRYVIDRPLPYPDASESNIGEISRMAIAPHFRRRHADQGKIQGSPEEEMSGKQEGARRHQPELVLGMYREVYQLCRSLGIDYCVAAMDSHFSRLLVALGFPFVPVGPVNEGVRPPRRVFLISAREMERSLGEREAKLLSFMQASEGLQTAS